MSVSNEMVAMFGVYIRNFPCFTIGELKKTEPKAFAEALANGYIELDGSEYHLTDQGSVFVRGLRAQAA